jgi:hypothetical protein
MTSSITSITAASDGESTAGRQTHERAHGLAVLRDSEAKALISLACDALSETHALGSQMHTGIYDPPSGSTCTGLQDTLAELLACMERAEHYLLMLGCVFDESTRPSRPSTPGS